MNVACINLFHFNISDRYRGRGSEKLVVERLDE